MLEIENIRAVQKGSLLATCDVHIVPWKMRLHEIKIFEKGMNRWIGLPAKDKLKTDGTKEYIELVSFDTEGVKSRFRDQIMGAVDKYLAGNPEMKPEDVVTENDELPW